MSDANFAPSNTTRIDPKIGHVVEDQRSGDRSLLIYVDAHVVLTRDEAANTTLTPRTAFDPSLGSRYRLREDGSPDVDAGQYGHLRELLAEYETRDGRKAAHKADALREALSILTDRSCQSVAEGEEDVDAESTQVEPAGDHEIPFEAVPGIGPETAGKLRMQGFVTEGDVERASDDDILAVAGVGPSNLENLRDHLA